MPVIGKMIMVGITRQEFHQRIIEAIKQDIFVESCARGHMSITYHFEDEEAKDKFLASQKVDEERHAKSFDEVINAKI